MNMDYEKAIKLKHYCTFIEEALRGVLNTKDFSNLNPDYWINSLTRFSDLINEILGKETKEYKKLYEKIFISLLNASYEKNVDVSGVLEVAEKITNEVYKKLYGGTNE